MEIVINASRQRFRDLPIEVKIIASFWLEKNPMHTEMGDCTGIQEEDSKRLSPLVTVGTSGLAEYVLCLSTWRDKKIVRVNLYDEHGDWEFVIFNKQED